MAYWLKKRDFSIIPKFSIFLSADFFYNLLLMLVLSVLCLYSKQKHSELFLQINCRKTLAKKWNYIQDDISTRVDSLRCLHRSGSTGRTSRSKKIRKAIRNADLIGYRDRSQPARALGASCACQLLLLVLRSHTARERPGIDYGQ